MRLRNKNNGVCESKERKKNNLGKIFNRGEYQQKFLGGFFWGSSNSTYLVNAMFLVGLGRLSRAALHPSNNSFGCFSKKCKFGLG